MINTKQASTHGSRRFQPEGNCETSNFAKVCFQLYLPPSLRRNQFIFIFLAESRRSAWRRFSADIKYVMSIISQMDQKQFITQGNVMQQRKVFIHSFTKSTEEKSAKRKKFPSLNWHLLGHLDCKSSVSSTS